MDMKSILPGPHFIREQVCDKTVSLNYCSTSEMIADMLTKGLSIVKFELLRKMAGITSFIIKQSEKEC